MQTLQTVLNASWLWRILTAVSLWFGKQWKNSRLVQGFVNPKGLDIAIVHSSIFYRIWQAILSGLRFLYRKLHLDKLFTGSVFLQAFFWCALPAVLGPILPTMAVLGLVLVGYCSMALTVLHDDSRLSAFAPMNRYIILYAAVFIVGTFASVTLSASLQIGLLTVAFTLFCCVLQNAVATRKQLDLLLAALVLAATAVALYGIYQYIFRTGYNSAAWVDEDMFSSITFRISATLQNPNMLGQYFLLTFPLSGALLLSAKGWGERALWLACCGIQAVALILTFSRGAWLGLVIAGAVFIILLNPRLIVLFPFALVALYFVLPETVVSRFTSIGNLTDNSTSYRVSILLASIDMLKDYWLCGIGPGDAAFNLVYPAYSYSSIVAPHSHNLFLQIICDAGITALLVFLAVLVHYFRQLCAALHVRKDWKSQLLQIASISSIIGFLAQGMTDFSFYNHRVMFMFWIFIALGSLCARRDALPEGGMSR